MTNLIYVIFARQGFGYGEETYPKEAHLNERDAIHRLIELNEPEDDTWYFYNAVKLISADNPIRE